MKALLVNEVVSVDAEEARTVGRRVRHIRKARRKPLQVIAGLAGMSKSKLDRIERGEVALDKLSDIVALADALEIAPSELMRLPIPAPANGHTDSAIKAVFLALVAVNRNRPGGQVLPVEAMRAKVRTVMDAHGHGRSKDVGAALPGLIRDIHTSISAGRDVAALLDLAVLLHAHVTVGWLRVAGAALELRELAAELATRVAEDRETPEARGLAVWGGLHVLVTAGAGDLARVELDSVSVPTRTAEGMQLAGVLALCRSFLAVVDSRPGELDASLEYAAELAGRAGEVNAYGLGFGPQEVGQWRVLAVLEAGDPELAVHLAESLQPGAHPIRTRQAQNWITYGRALARLRRPRREDAVLAFRRAELILPQYLLRDPISREVLAELRGRVRRDSPAGRELHGMAYRAGLPM